MVAVRHDEGDAETRRWRAGDRGARAGNSSTRVLRRAKHSRRSGQAGHWGWRGRQIKAPSSMRPWLSCDGSARWGRRRATGRVPKFVIDDFVARISSDAEEAAQDADHVAVENGRGLVEGDAAYGPRRVAAHAGQRQHGGKGVGKLAGVVADDYPGGGLGVADAIVIT